MTEDKPTIADMATLGVEKCEIAVWGLIEASGGEVKEKMEDCRLGVAEESVQRLPDLTVVDKEKRKADIVSGVAAEVSKGTVGLVPVTRTGLLVDGESRPTVLVFMLSIGAARDSGPLSPVSSVMVSVTVGA